MAQTNTESVFRVIENR